MSTGRIRGVPRQRRTPPLGFGGMPAPAEYDALGLGTCGPDAFRPRYPALGLPMHPHFEPGLVSPYGKSICQCATAWTASDRWLLRAQTSPRSCRRTRAPLWSRAARTRTAPTLPRSPPSTLCRRCRHPASTPSTRPGPSPSRSRASCSTTSSTSAARSSRWRPTRWTRHCRRYCPLLLILCRGC
jgi:hypothetical protein